jgi:hypothetical protein
MGKHANAESLRLVNTQDWYSQFYSDSFNYSNILGQDYVIRDYVLNFLTKFKIQTVRIDIKRSGSNVIIDIQTYNDYSTFTEAFLNSYSQQVHFKKIALKNDLESNQLISSGTSLTNSFRSNIDKEFKDFLPSRVVFKPIQDSLNSLDKAKYAKLRYSMKRILALNLSYYLKTNVIVRNKNIINQSPVLLDLFWSLASKLRSPLPSHLNLKFIYLVYHALQHKSALLLCRQLAILVPRFCKKKRKNRKMNPFFYSLKKLIKTLFSNGFCNKNDIKGVKIVLKGRLSGAPRKGKYVLEYGKTSAQTLSDRVSYYQEDCFTLFGVSGIKVWIIY